MSNGQTEANICGRYNHQYKDKKDSSLIFCVKCGNVIDTLNSGNNNSSSSNNIAKPRVSSSKIKVSSIHNVNHDERGCQLNFQGLENKVWHSLAWCTKDNNNLGNEYIVIDFGKILRWIKLDIQGRGDAAQYVTKYRLYYKLDNNSAFEQDWILLEDDIRGCFDSHTINSYVLREPINCRYVKLTPTAFEGFQSLRWEVYASDL